MFGCKLAPICCGRALERDGQEAALDLWLTQGSLEHWKKLLTGPLYSCTARYSLPESRLLLIWQFGQGSYEHTEERLKQVNSKKTVPSPLTKTLGSPRPGCAIPTWDVGASGGNPKVHPAASEQHLSSLVTGGFPFANKREIISIDCERQFQIDLTAPSSGSLSTLLTVQIVWPNGLKRAACGACFSSEQHKKSTLNTQHFLTSSHNKKKI